MANGFMGSREAWDRLEAPLLLLDSMLQSAANRYGLQLRKNHKAPERSLLGASVIQYLFQIFPADEAAPRFNVWICAFQDRPDGRYWKTETVLRNADAHQITESVLEQSLKRLLSWNESDLVHTESRDA